jgi:hypothetical protein
MLQIRNSQYKNTSVGYTHTGDYKWYQERSISLGRKKRDDMKTKDMKRKILRKYNIAKKENLDQVIEELKKYQQDATIF